MKFELELAEVNIVLQGLGELPAKLSMNLIKVIQEQAASQMQPIWRKPPNEKIINRTTTYFTGTSASK